MLLRYLTQLMQIAAPILWLIAAGTGMWGLTVIAPHIQGKSFGTLDWMMQAGISLVFLTLTIYSLRQAYKEAIEAAHLLRNQDTLAAEKRARIPVTRTPRIPLPLTESEQTYLRKCLSAFTQCGLLNAGEVNTNTLLESAEHDEEYTFDAASFLNLLADASSETNYSLSNLIFFINQVEFFEKEAIRIVTEMARLSGNSERLGKVDISANYSITDQGGHPAIASFDFDGQHQSLPFILYIKYIPFDLVEQTSAVFTPTLQSDHKHFYTAGAESVFALMVLSESQRHELGETISLDELELTRCPPNTAVG